MVVECKYCEAIVKGEYVESYTSLDKEIAVVFKYTFLKCPQCEGPFIVCQADMGGNEWDDPYQMYPAREKQVSTSLPKVIRDSLQEAVNCFKGKTFTASVIMCRRTLEGICHDHKIECHNLSLALKEMKDKGLIEKRLFDWAELLRISGNEAAHDLEIAFSKQDAKDILEFTEAILEYIYTFKEKFDDFMKRKAKQQASKV